MTTDDELLRAAQALKVYARIQCWAIARLREPGRTPTLHIAGYFIEHERLTGSVGDEYLSSPCTAIFDVVGHDSVISSAVKRPSASTAIALSSIAMQLRRAFAWSSGCSAALRPFRPCTAPWYETSEHDVHGPRICIIKPVSCREHRSDFDTYSAPVIDAARGEVRNAIRSATSRNLTGRSSGMPPRPFVIICQADAPR
jgi:hypothetical protein